MPARDGLVVLLLIAVLPFAIGECDQASFFGIGTGSTDHRDVTGGEFVDSPQTGPDFRNIQSFGSPNDRSASPIFGIFWIRPEKVRPDLGVPFFNKVGMRACYAETKDLCMGIVVVLRIAA